MRTSLHRGPLPALFALAVLLCGACSGRPAEPGPGGKPRAGPRPSILLVTLDTTRADVLGYEGGGGATPHLDALARRSLRFRRALSTAPMTLPAHASMMTGVYPAEHGIHENARFLGEGRPLLAERLREGGYRTAAFVSGFPLSRRFGLARGFDHYDEELGRHEDGRPRAERRADATTAAALAYLASAPAGPLFLWVHYFDPHEPYDPPEPFRSRFAGDPYRGEVAFMDAHFGRLLEAFEARAGDDPRWILVLGDHGEGRGDHGEALHGNLLYQGVMQVPLLIAGGGVVPADRPEPVSTRRIFHTALAAAGLGGGEGALFGARREVVLGEALKPFLQYGWQPQVMAVMGGLKAIHAGDLEVYDLDADPGETTDLAGSAELDRELRAALKAYPIAPLVGSKGSEGAATAAVLGAEDRERLASLGYAGGLGYSGGSGSPTLRPDAPAPREMTHLFAALDRGSALFVQERYRQSAEVFEAVEEEDPGNLMVKLRLAVAYSALGQGKRALAYFEKARQLDPGSVDVRHYLAMHLFGAGDRARAAPLLETVLAQDPSRLPALETLVRIRAEEGDLARAAALQERIAAIDPDPADAFARLGELYMGLGRTAAAIRAFEAARDRQGDAFRHHLELGVCYLADRRVSEARDALDQVSGDHPEQAMALFKRAQVSVLLGEPDHPRRIRRALEAADEVTRELILREPLFQGIGY